MYKPISLYTGGGGGGVMLGFRWEVAYGGWSGGQLILSATIINKISTFKP